MRYEAFDQDVRPRRQPAGGGGGDRPRDRSTTSRCGPPAAAACGWCAPGSTTRAARIDGHLVQPGAPRPRPRSPGDELLLRGQGRAATAGARSRCAATRSSAGPGSEGLHTRGLVPVYRATEQMPARRIRELVDLARPLARAAPERLPAWVRERLGLPGAADALVAVHFPRSRREARLGRRRMVIEELLVLQLGLEAVRRAPGRRPRSAPVLRGHRRALGAAAGRAAVHADAAAAPRRRARSRRDLARARPMRRLLQGEVGSGKTLVAVLAICQAVEAGAQAAVLVPTETLAEQHLRTLDAPPGARRARAGAADRARCPRAERERRRMALRTGTAPVVVGTQALLSEGVGVRPPRAGGGGRAAPLRRGAAPGARRARHRRATGPPTSST